jgi:hypothetical protein
MDDQRADREEGIAADEKWIVVVEPMPRADAEREMAQWLKRQAESGINYAPSEIRMDMLCGRGCEQSFRYLVQSKQK